ncbi:MYCBP-associated protein [Cyprinodon tularosa]|uniref:MYCBP-associated protein n=1 Tax=Cyprinodon tularosa TaxID=77115 RepID=UPI0018E26541|nr:MYCBP-associated protein [Cyprinodon tularosa]
MPKSEQETVHTPGDVQAAGSQYNEKRNKPKPPKGLQTLELRANQNSRICRNANDSEVAPLVKDSKQTDFTAYLRFDEHGMILPHSILGSLDDFRSYLERKGETDLLKKIPKTLWDPTSEAPRPSRDTIGRGRVLDQRSTQSNALQRWDEHMTYTRRKQEELSHSLNRPVETLLMNQAKHFRETQEQKEHLNRVMQFTHSGYGYHQGSEFWSLPQHYSDELSGIRDTLTQTERGQKKPITYVGHPNSIQMEMGILSSETERPASRSWAQSAYLEEKSHELRDILKDMDIRKPDFSELEVIGTRIPLSSLSEPQSLLLQKEEEKKKENEMTKEQLETLAETDDVPFKALPGPALRIRDQLARWTGNQTFHEGEVGISTCVVFESQTGQVVSTNLELQNEGSVILPSETQRVEFIFKSEEPGYWTELWQLNTHPLLLQGASIQVRLSGTAIHVEETADLRCFIEKKLENAVVEKQLRSIVQDIVEGVQTPKRPSSPAELYITEQQLFNNKNPKAVLSLPDGEPIKEDSLHPQLSEPLDVNHHLLTTAITVRPLWTKLLDSMADEAMRLKDGMGLPEKETWDDMATQSPTDDKIHDKLEPTAKEDKSGSKSKDTRKSKGWSPTAGRLLEEERKEQGKHPDSVADISSKRTMQIQSVDSETILTYKTILHKKVYALVEDFLDNLCDLMDDRDLQSENCCA